MLPKYQEGQKMPPSLKPWRHFLPLALEKSLNVIFPVPNFPNAEQPQDNP
jgi:hypothetical protein